MVQRQIVLYIACSPDGYIAGPKDDLSFLNLVTQTGQDYGYESFISGVDTVITGRKTYDWVIKQGIPYPHTDKETYILTRKAKPPQGTLTFYTDSPKELVEGLKQKEGKTIFCEGGSEIVHLLLKEGLIDKIILSVVPIFRQRRAVVQERLPRQAA